MSDVEPQDANVFSGSLEEALAGPCVNIDAAEIRMPNLPLDTQPVALTRYAGVGGDELDVSH